MVLVQLVWIDIKWHLFVTLCQKLCLFFGKKRRNDHYALALKKVLLLTKSHLICQGEVMSEYIHLLWTSEKVGSSGLFLAIPLVLFVFLTKRKRERQMKIYSTEYWKIGPRLREKEDKKKVNEKKQWFYDKKFIKIN